MTNELDIDKLDKLRKQTSKDIIENLKENQSVLCERYTGFGKSYYVINKLVNYYNTKTLIIVPNTNLKNSYTDTYLWYPNVQIISYHYLCSHRDDDLKERYKNIGLIICDECHHLGADTWGLGFENLIKQNPDAKLVGFTATPERLDGVDIVKKYFGDNILKPINLLDAINEKLTQKLKYVVSYADVKAFNNYKLKEVDRYKMENLINVPNIIKKYLTEEYIKDNCKILLFVSMLKYVPEAKETAEKWFKEAYPDKVINIYTLDSQQNTNFNKNQLAKFKESHSSNQIDILISVNKVSEGLHLPQVSTVMMLRKTRSNCVYTQQLGRAINGTNQPLVFDFISNYKQLIIDKQFIQRNNKNYLNSIKYDKEMFDTCVELIDETKDIQAILEHYIRRKLKERTSITPELITAVVEDYKTGNYLQRELCEKYNICLASLCSILKSNGLINSQKEELERVKDAIQNDIEYVNTNNGKVTLAHFIEYFNTSKSTLKTAFRDLGIEFKRTVSPYNVSPELIDSVLSLLEQGKRQREICELLNISRSLYISCRKKPKIAERIQNGEFNNTLLTDDIINLIQEMADENTTVVDIYNEYVSRYSINNPCLKASIRRYLKCHNLPCKTMKVATTVTPEVEEDIIRCFNKIGTLQGVQNELGYHKETIKKVLLRHNIKVPESRYENRRYAPTKEQIEAVVCLRKEGKTKRDIRTELNLTFAVINRILIESGLE